MLSGYSNNFDMSHPAHFPHNWKKQTYLSKITTVNNTSECLHAGNLIRNNINSHKWTQIHIQSQTKPQNIISKC